MSPIGVFKQDHCVHTGSIVVDIMTLIAAKVTETVDIILRCLGSILRRGSPPEDKRGMQYRYNMIRVAVIIVMIRTEMLVRKQIVQIILA